MRNTVSHDLQMSFFFSYPPAPPPSPATIPAGISEWYSPAEPGTGLHPRPSDASTLRAYFPEIDDSWSSVWYPTRLGEDFAALHDRVAGFLSVFVPEIERRFAGKHKRILLVSHAATVIALTRELVGDRDLSFKAACCSITVLDSKVAAAAEGDAGPPAVVGGWAVRLLADGGHLKQGLLRAWGFEDTVLVNGEVRIFILEL
jgi:transcription factor C subunit 7